MELPQIPNPGNQAQMPGYLPVGTVIAFAGKVSDPVNPGQQPAFTTVVSSQGWLLCDGNKLKKQDYGKLYQALGDLYNRGDEKSDEFRLPDYRGYFLRMTDMGSGNDPDASSRKLTDGTTSNDIGSIEQDALQQHQHSVPNPGPPTSPAGAGATPAVIQVSQTLSGEPTDNLLQPPGTVRTSSETRPKNVYVYYLVKYN